MDHPILANGGCKHGRNLSTHADCMQSLGQIASLDPCVPVIADADTGYGGPIMVSRTVTQYARAGVAALHIEDQVIAGPAHYIGDY